MKKFILFFVIAIFLLTLNACAKAQQSAENPNQKAADFTVEALDASKITLSDILKNKKAVLVFWTTWCPYCVREIPAVEKFYSENKGKTEVIGINLQESKEKVMAFVQKQNISYKIALDQTGNVGRLYSVRGVPTVVAVDKDSSILYYGHSIEEMEGKVKF